MHQNSWLTLSKMATVVVERSNSFNSNIDWIVHGIGGSRPHASLFVSFVSFSAALIAWTERPRSFRICMYVYRIVVNGLRVNRFVFAHAREASINIPTDTDTYITDRPLTHTHTHTNTQTQHTTDLVIQQYATLQRTDENR